MKKIVLIGLLFLFGNTSAIAKTEDSNQTINKQEVLTIDFDKEIEEIKKHPKRAKENDLINTVIFIEEEKAILFKGKLLKNNSPITIKVGHIVDSDDDNDEVSFIDSFTGLEYSIETKGLNDGDYIIMQDKNGQIFSKQTIRLE